MDAEKTYFKPRARLMLELGEQLIKNESVAILELIKMVMTLLQGILRYIFKIWMI